MVRAKRATTGFKTAPDLPTAAAVAERIHAGWYLVRDSCRSRENRRHCVPVVSRFARDHDRPGCSFPLMFGLMLSTLVSV